MHEYVSSTSYGLAAALFAVLSGLLLTAWRGRLLGGLLLIACAATVVWAGLLAYYARSGAVPLGSVAALEMARAVAWLLFLGGILGRSRADGGQAATNALLAVALAGALAVGISVFVPGALTVLPAERLQLVVFLVLSVVGLALVEQLFRGTRREDRWQIKFLCIGLGAQFAFDFFLYSHGVLFRTLDPELWAARGAVQALVVPFLALTAVRNPEWQVQIFVSRHVVFGSAAVLGAGLYLVAMAGAGYYIRLLGGSWGRTGQLVFFFGAVLLLLVLLSSGQVRARAKVFLAKHFFRNKYEYREAWLAFTQALSGSGTAEELRENIIRGIAALIESPGGAMWTEVANGGFVLNGRWGHCSEPPGRVAAGDSLTSFLRETGWVVYVDDCLAEPAEYDGLALPPWLGGSGMAIVLPLVHQSRLIGFIALREPAIPRRFDWEDTDLLKTAGSQAAGNIALLEVSEALADARQFEAFNRLSSYVVHDLKNLVAQLALVVKNSERHLDNPAFVRDAIDTVANASARMQRLLDQLRKGRLEETSTRLVNVGRVARKALALCAGRKPAPVLERLDEGLVVRADAERLQNILCHVVQNAQEATPDTGSVRVRAFHDGRAVRIEIDDDGTGMDEAFVANRLFRPFETTKGNAGMGIGVYETREFVRLWGGDVEVVSAPGKGTCFRILLPEEGGVARQSPESGSDPSPIDMALVEGGAAPRMRASARCGAPPGSPAGASAGPESSSHIEVTS